MDVAVDVTGVEKSFGGHRVLSGLDLRVSRGEVVGLLGRNGAGKTTTVRILATLLDPDGGRASIAGHDVVRDRRRARACLGLAGQYAAVDQHLTGRENLVLIARLHQLGLRGSRARATELLASFGLDTHADRPVRTYSGGLRRRLDLAISVITDPAVLILDEPTTGLDPASRAAVWRLVLDQAAAGVAVLLTTQYLEEADRLADRVVVLDGGQVAAEGTPAALKRGIGGDVLEITVAAASSLSLAASVLADVATAEPVVRPDQRKVQVPLSGGIEAIAVASSALNRSGVEVEDFAIRRPSLDEVFLGLVSGVSAS
ncbi:ATP-binding cassette domain-containing protein [Lentzea sp. NPDC055074]